MTEFSTLLQQGNAWLFVPGAILLGALHGLEPGHSKTMMAAFIVAIRGTLTQAILLGLAATLSHTAVVWAIAMTGLYFGQSWSVETTEPYFQLASGVLIITIALWMLWRTWQQQHTAHAHHHHATEEKPVTTDHGTVRLEVFEDGVPPRVRLFFEDAHDHDWQADQIRLETERPDGSRQQFTFAQHDGFIESHQPVPEPHEFIARLCLRHEKHDHDYEIGFAEPRPHHHAATVAMPETEYQDAHERAHAEDIRRRFANREATTGQIVLFGLTGGLIPCPASITVLLLCLQLKKVALGATLVLGFSVGLALTIVASGVLAALSVRHLAGHWSGFGEFTRKAPYVSGLLIILTGMYVGWHGWQALA